MPGTMISNFTGINAFNPRFSPMRWKIILFLQEVINSGNKGACISCHQGNLPSKNNKASTNSDFTGQVVFWGLEIEVEIDKVAAESRTSGQVVNQGVRLRLSESSSWKLNLTAPSFLLVQPRGASASGGPEREAPGDVTALQV